MKLLALLAGALVALATLVTSTAVASADEAPSCAAAVTAFADADAKAKAAAADDKAAADAQTLYDTLAAARAEVAAAVKADNDTVPPLDEDSQRTKDAKAAEGKAKAAVDAFEAKGTTLEQLRTTAAKTDADALAKTAADLRAAADKACKGSTVTITPSPSPAPPVANVVPIPARIDTGRA